MPSIVILGAGAIGRGFIAPLFTAAGWDAVLCDLDRDLVAELDRRRGYRLRLVDAAGERLQEVPVRAALAADDAPAVAAALAACDLAATAVGITVLPRLAPLFAAALRTRGGALDVLLCENGAGAAEALRAALAAAGGDPARLGCVRTTIGRMVPPPGPGADLAAEPWSHLPVERAAFRGAPPAVPGLEPVDDMDLAEAGKLHLHNLTHAALAYHGLRAGLATIAEAVAEPGVRAEAEACAAEVIEALGRSHGAAATADARRLADGLFARYANPRLADPLPRVARDPARKLAAGDRLVGAARRCRAAGVAPHAIARAIAAALRHRPPVGEPGSPRFRAWQDLGPAALLARTAGELPADLADLVLAAWRTQERRERAAARLAAAGIVLRPAEERAIEIADFGLDRYEEVGLAILVYVNTERCCAKELAMLPGQICPEHRHPSVAGAAGKEETFRVRSGAIDLFLPGPGERDAALARLPADLRGTVSVLRRLHLEAGQQATLAPDTPHWFVAGPAGAVVSEFSTRSRDEADVFTDARIVRVPA